MPQKNATLKKYDKEKAALKKLVDDIRYEGTGARSGSRKQVDRLEEQITQSQSRLDRCKQKYERLHRTLVDVQAGVEHLVLKMSTVSTKIGGSAEKLPDGSSVVEMVYHCERTLMNMLRQLKRSGACCPEDQLTVPTRRSTCPAAEGTWAAACW